MPIHIRAEPGEYAEAVLLPGDPLRAKYIAETYLDDVEQRNAERGLLGYTGTYKGKPVSVQGTGMGCPGATIVFEELIQLGCKKLIRVGTCGGLQPHHQLGDLIVALTAVPADSTAMHLVGNEPHCPTASWSPHPRRRAHGEGAGAGRCTSGRSCRATSSTTRTAASTSAGRSAACSRSRWRPSALFTVGAIRGVETGCLLTVSDIVVEGEFTAHQRRRPAGGGRPDDEDRARRRDRPLAPRPSSSSIRRRNGATGKRWPELAHRAERLGLTGETLFSERPGHLIELAASAVDRGAELVVAVGGDGTLNEVVNGVARREVELATIPLGTGMDFVRTYGIPTRFDDAVRVARDGTARTIDAGRVRYRTWGGEDAERWFANVGSVGMSGAVAQRANGMSKALGGKATFFYALTRVFLEWENTEVTVKLDDAERHGRMHDVIVANGVWHGGGMMLAPDAKPDDGLFEVVLIGDVGEGRLPHDRAEDLQGKARQPPEGRRPAQRARRGRRGRASADRGRRRAGRNDAGGVRARAGRPPRAGAYSFVAAALRRARPASELRASPHPRASRLASPAPPSASPSPRGRGRASSRSSTRSFICIALCSTRFAVGFCCAFC